MGERVATRVTYVELGSLGFRGGGEEEGGGLGKHVVDCGVHPVPVHRSLRIGPGDPETCSPETPPGLHNGEKRFTDRAGYVCC